MSVHKLFPSETIESALLNAAERLRKSGVGSPALDARILLANALSCPQETLMMEYQRVLTAQEIRRFEIGMVRRETREPMSHILGEREFYGTMFTVSSDVLDPRPDSETLIDVVQKKFPDKNAFLRVLDLGVGSGCLLLTLLSLYPKIHGVGVDISEKALKQFRKNAKQLNLEHRVESFRSQWFLDLPREMQQSFDCIISNPPYIPTQDIASLEPEVRDYEPMLALDGGEDGLDAYREIIADIGHFLKPGGLAIFECGIGQAEAILELMELMDFTEVEITKDLAGIERVISGKVSD